MYLKITSNAALRVERIDPSIYFRILSHTPTRASSSMTANGTGDTIIKRCVVAANSKIERQYYERDRKDSRQQTVATSDDIDAGAQMTINLPPRKWWGLLRRWRQPEKRGRQQPRSRADERVDRQTTVLRDTMRTMLTRLRKIHALCVFDLGNRVRLDRSESSSKTSAVDGTNAKRDHTRLSEKKKHSTKVFGARFAR